jgi:hypothetical protein
VIGGLVSGNYDKGLPVHGRRTERGADKHEGQEGARINTKDRKVSG